MKETGISWIGEIPDDWKVGRVQQFYKVHIGFTPYTKSDAYYESEGGCDWATISDLNGKTLITETEKKISPESAARYSIEEVPTGSLLYSCKLSVGLTAFTGKPMYTNEAIASFFPDEGIDLHYLRYSSMFIAKNAERNSFGAEILNKRRIREALILFPPLNEQKRIPSFLDDECERIDTAIRETETSLEALARYRSALISQMLTGHGPAQRKTRDTEMWGRIPEGWSLIRLRYCIRSWDYGFSAMSDDGSEESEFAILRTGAVSSGVFLPQEAKKVLRSAVDRLICPVEKDTLIVSRMNSPALVGACALVEEEYPNLFLSDKMWKLRCENNCMHRYMWYVLNSQTMRQAVRNLATGTSETMQAVSYDDYSNLYVPIPPLEEQKRICAQLDSKVHLIDALIQKKRALLDALGRYRNTLVFLYVTGKRKVPES